MKKRVEEEASFTHVEKFNLDVEWERQADLYMSYAEQAAEAKLDLANAKDSLAVIEATVKLEVLANPESFGLMGKPTVDAISSIVVTTERYKAACAALNNAKYTVDILSGSLQALEHKKAALEDICTLDARNYFARPQAPRESSIGDARKKKVRNKSRED